MSLSSSARTLVLATIAVCALSAQTVKVVGKSGASVKHNAHTASCGESTVEARFRHPRSGLRRLARFRVRLRPVRALAALSQTRGCGTGAAREWQDVLGFLAHRSHDQGLPECPEGPSPDVEFQHHSRLDVQDGEARQLSRMIPNQVTWDYTQGTELRDPTWQEVRRLLRDAW